MSYFKNNTRNIKSLSKSKDLSKLFPDFKKYGIELCSQDNQLIDKYKEKLSEGGVTPHILLGILTKKPTCCKECGCTSEYLVKNGSFIQKILLNPLRKHKTYLILQKQRFKCRECAKSCSAETDFVKRGSNISNEVKLSIMLELQEIRTVKQIARFNDVSDMTVHRIITDVYKRNKKFLTTLPEVICIDEFKSVKGQMSFVCLDGITGELLETLDYRTNNWIYNFFSSFSIQERKKVKYIVMDMYLPYLSVLKQCFPNTEIVFDMFHIVQHITRAFSKTRIEIMNRYNTKDKEYKMLKKFWKLLLKKEFDLNDKTRNYVRQFKNYYSQKEIVLKILNDVGDDMQFCYQCMQEIMAGVSLRNYTYYEASLNKWINKKEVISNRIFKVLEFFQENNKYIKNALDTTYTNGIIENTIGRCKKLKNISYGFGSFTNLKARLFMILKPSFVA